MKCWWAALTSRELLLFWMLFVLGCGERKKREREREEKEKNRRVVWSFDSQEPLVKSVCVSGDGSPERFRSPAVSV